MFGKAERNAVLIGHDDLPHLHDSHATPSPGAPSACAKVGASRNHGVRLHAESDGRLGHAFRALFGAEPAAVSRAISFFAARSCARRGRVVHRRGGGRRGFRDSFALRGRFVSVLRMVSEIAAPAWLSTHTDQNILL